MDPCIRRLAGFFSSTLMAIKKKRSSVERLRKAQWKEVEVEVIAKLRALHALVDKMEPNAENDAMVEQAIVPILSLLGRFCSAVVLGRETIALYFKPSKTPTPRPDQN